MLRAIVKKETGRVDLASEFGYPLAIRTVTEMVGLPVVLEGWLLGRLKEHASETAVEQAAHAPQEVTDYFRQIVRVRQQEGPRGQLRLDVTHSPNPHLAFGTGMHYCIGTELARIDMLAALRLAMQALPELTPDDREPFIRVAGLIDYVEQAPFVFNQRAAEKLLK